jgi:hypothetical protein
MPALSLVWNEWYKGGLYKGYKSHHEARCKHCITARVREILTIEVNAYASGDRLVPPRSEADIFEYGEYFLLNNNDFDWLTRAFHEYVQCVGEWSNENMGLNQHRTKLKEMSVKCSILGDHSLTSKNSATECELNSTLA